MSIPVPHLAGNYAPVGHEVTAHELPVTGAVPAELTGWYLRNGPNPHEAASAHWFLGDGMVHGVRLEGGRATAFRNRWVRTSAFTDGKQLFDQYGNRDLTAGNVNTHVVRHAGRTLALAESSLPYLLSPDLETVGPHDFDGKLTTPMTAHPKTCPVTGQLHFFGYGMLTPPFLTYYRANANGDLELSRVVEGVGPTMMHDFALTRRHVVFLDLPVVFDLKMAMGGDPFPYRWNPSYGARLGVLRRDEPHGAVRWFDVEPCYVFHVGYAYDDGDDIVLGIIRYPHLWRSGSGEAYPESTLWRWTVNLRTEKVIEEQLDDRNTEFPRVDERLAGLDSRFVHTITAPAHPRHDPVPGSLLRYDTHTGEVAQHTFSPGRVPSEAAFAPADDRAGGDGWLMTYVFDEAKGTSDLVIVDITDMAAKPVAIVHLPQRVPYGFHGNWLPDA